MKTLVRPTDPSTFTDAEMARKKKDAMDASQKIYHQMSLRILHEDYLRLERIAAKLGLDTTNLARMIIKKHMGAFERLAEEEQ